MLADHSGPGAMKATHPSLNDRDLARLESDTFKYFLHELHPATGLTADSTREGSPSSIAVVGFALTVYPIAVERRYLSRAEAVKRTLARLRFFYHGPDGEGPDAIGRKGFYYHFLDMKTGRHLAVRSLYHRYRDPDHGRFNC